MDITTTSSLLDNLHKMAVDEEAIVLPVCCFRLHAYSFGCRFFFTIVLSSFAAYRLSVVAPHADFCTFTFFFPSLPLCLSIVTCFCTFTGFAVFYHYANLGSTVVSTWVCAVYTYIYIYIYICIYTHILVVGIEGI